LNKGRALFHLTPLRYSNVEVAFYGADASFGYRLDGSVSFTRARRRDIDDGILRVASLNGSASSV